MKRNIRILVLALSLIPAFLGICASTVSAGTSEVQQEIPIYPTWQLMNDEAKRQFTAGYIFGHREAVALGEVVVDYLKQNPNPSAEDVAKILSHYRLTLMTANQLVPLIDKYLEESENRQQSMRVIINNLNRR
ncbi:MAG: hypothetical protein KDD66_11545 [Bdellovibrionales bacterium]|nr:hypothetical protein [Bdellovibrionales bacterium]